MKLWNQRPLVWASGTLLTLSGLALAGWYGASLVRTYSDELRRLADSDAEIMRPPTQPVVLAPPREGALLGSVSIPRVGVSSGIIEGSEPQDLAVSVGHIPGTAMPGREGNVALAAHRDTFFRGLEFIRRGDDILVTTSQGTLLYQVDNMRVVFPKDVYVLKDVGRPVLTLVTCYPFHFVGDAPQRLIVQARLMGPQSISAESRGPRATGAHE